MTTYTQLLKQYHDTCTIVKQLEEQLIEIRQQSSNSIPWRQEVEKQLRILSDSIKSLNVYENKLKSIQLSLKKDIKNLNHQIVKLTTQQINEHKINENNSKQIVKRKVHNRHRHNQIPDTILNNSELRTAISRALPSNYNFEIYKTIWRLKSCSPSATRVGLQFPEGLLMYSCIISDILCRFACVECIILGDVTYGACCIDDYTSNALKCDFLIHYGHSCLISINNMNEIYEKRILYIFVEIRINPKHLINTIKLNFNPLKEYHNKTIVLAGTIQFVSMLQNLKYLLCSQHGYNSNNILIPQSQPLSPGEVLGCTSPNLQILYKNIDIECILFISDGRFHLESIMISNPNIHNFYKYNPYNNKITNEKYDIKLMKKIRFNAINMAKNAYYNATWCIVLSTLGRQGSNNILKRLTKMLKDKNIKYITVLLSEIYGNKLKKFNLDSIGVFIQIGCPRLSIDWGANVVSNDIPLLNSYEATVALQEIKWKNVYPMDYYSNNGGIWSNYYMTKEEKKLKEIQKKERRKKQRKQKLLLKNKNKIKKTNHITLEYQ